MIRAEFKRPAVRQNGKFIGWAEIGGFERHRWRADS